MGRVIWAPSALADADAIAEFIARDSHDRAALLIARLLEAADRLARFPESGRVIPELNEPTKREIIVTPYRLMYRLEGNEVWIVAVVHGARDWPRPPRP